MKKFWLSRLHLERETWLSNANEHVWNLVEPGIGTWYESVYSGREGSIRVLLIKP